MPDYLQGIDAMHTHHAADRSSDFVEQLVDQPLKAFREHLERLVQAEYVVPHGRGQGKLHRYSLLYGGCELDGRQSLLGLVDADALIDPKPDTTTATWH